MKAKQLSAELEAREAAKTGRKGQLQQRLHALLIRAQIECWRADGFEGGLGGGGDGGAAEDELSGGTVEGGAGGGSEGEGEGAPGQSRLA